MSANLSATIYMEDNGQGGTIPVVVYSKTTTYETKIGGDKAWQHNNYFGIKDSVDDVNLIAGKIPVTNSDGWFVWPSSNDPSPQLSNFTNWWPTAFVDDTTTIGDVLDAFRLISNSSFNSNVFIINFNKLIHVEFPDVNATLDSTFAEVGVPFVDMASTAMLQSFQPSSNSQIYFDRGILTKVIGVNLYTGLPNSVRVQWDWTDTRDVIEEDILVTSLAFGGAGVVGWISNLFRGGISAGMIAATTGGGAVVGTQLTEEGESILPKLESVIVSESDSIPSFLTPQQIQSIQVNVNALAPRFSTLTIAQQNSLIMQQLALKLHGISTVINVVVQKMPDSFIVEYDPNAALPSPLIQVLFRWDQYGMALQNLQFQLSNGGNTTITPPQ